MRGVPRRNMFRLAQAIMIACVAALWGAAIAAKGLCPVLSPAFGCRGRDPGTNRLFPRLSS
jgi:hypothetical protein